MPQQTPCVRGLQRSISDEMVTRKIILGLLTLACIFVNGCFTCVAPFYEDGQIIQDSRIEGLHSNVGMASGPDDTEWLIKPSVEFKGKYDVEVREGRSSALLLGTLFRVDKFVFFDLYPIKDSPEDASQSGPPSVTELIRSIMYEPRHVAWKVEITDTSLNYWFPAGNGIVAALKQAPELKGKPVRGTLEEQPTITLPASTKEAQKYLLRFAADPNVFNYKGQLIKKKNGT
jgi:hypothetical protein